MTGDRLARLFPGGPEEGTLTAEGNSLTVAGRLNIARLIAGDPAGLPLLPTSVHSARVVVGVGEDATPNPEGVLALATLPGEAPHTTWYQQMDPGYPQVISPNMLSGQATMVRGVGTFDWNQWCWAVAPEVRQVGGPHLLQLAEGMVVLNRKVTPWGPKPADRVRVIQCSVSIL